MIAKYRQLAAELRDSITEGDYPPGTRFPTIAELATARGMGRNTVGAAISLLESEGLVRATTKTGIIVLNRKPVRVALSRYAAVLRPNSQAGPWETACQQSGIPGRMTLIEVETVPAPPGVAEALNLPRAGQRIVRRSRHAMLGDPSQVVQIHTASYPAKLVRGTPIARDGKVTGGIYGAFLAAGITPASAAETVGARPPTDDESAELHIRNGDVLTVDRVTRDTDGRPIEFLQVVANPARTILIYDPLPLTR